MAKDFYAEPNLLVQNDILHLAKFLKQEDHDRGSGWGIMISEYGIFIMNSE